MAVVIDGTTGIDKVQDGSIQTADLAANAVTAAKLDIGQVGGRRNLIINGAMQVAQRGTSATGLNTAVIYGTCDRWRFADNQNPSATYTQTQSTDAPNGFSNSLKMEVTTAQTSVTNVDQLQNIDCFLEAQDLQHLAYGTSDAKQITLSFWVKCSVAQNFGFRLQHEDGGGAYTKSYTINNANTWEYKTLTFPGNTSTAFVNDNGRGFRLRWGLMAGSNQSGSDSTAWGNGDTLGLQENTFIATVGNTWQITGVQLEVGDTATPFEHRSYGEELALCQRYYYAFINSGSGNEAWITTATSYNSSNAYGGVRFPVTMRAIPSLRQYTGTDVWQYYNNNQSDRFDSFTIFGANQTTTSAAMIYNNDVMSITAGQSGNYQGGNASCYMHFDAEL